MIRQCLNRRHINQDEDDDQCEVQAKMCAAYENPWVRMNSTEIETFLPHKPTVTDEKSAIEKGLMSETTQSIPRDRFYFAKWILMLHGVGTLLPWNMFTTAEAYFTEHKFGGVSDESTYKEKFLSYLGIAAFTPTLIFMLISLFTQHRESRWKTPMCIGFIMILSFETTILAILDTSAWPEQFFIITMVTIVVINGACAVYQSSMFGLAAKYPPTYMQFHITGQGVGGMLCAILNILTLAVSDSLRNAAILFFTCSIIVILLCLVSYFVLLKLPISLYYLNRSNQTSCSKLIASKEDEVYEKKSPPYLRIAKQVKVQLFNIWLTFFVTISMFPAVLAFVESSAPQPHSQLRVTYFTPVCCFLLFAIGDACGSFFSAVTQKPGPKYTWILCMARLLFLPLVLVCNYRPETRTLPVFFLNDMFFIAFNACIAFSHGYLKSIVMMHGPRCVKDPQHASTAAAMMALFMVIGIYMGVQTSLIFPWASTLM
ncbi:equilibrative nucleoside transporter 1-like [Antedon mediterranea]|uniref:equilibrative nucleoside transporter 1-like n=1 Tax=Antedon mediterranea TaxID=105859 RepID=UPI003AF8F7D7